MKIIDCTERLPENGQYVLAHFPDRPWSVPDCPGNKHKWVVVQFVRGTSPEEREELPHSDPRKYRTRGCDQHGNNLVPYCWNAFGPSSFFGQEASVWCALPEETHA